MKKIYLLGYPVGHSRSPELHNRWLQDAKIAAKYEALSIHSDELKSSVARLRDMNVLGANVTVPHKRSIIPFLDGLSDEAKAIGAVNTVVKVIRHEQNDRLVPLSSPDYHPSTLSYEGRGEIQLIGHNTDALGFLRDLDLKSIPYKNRDVLIFGNGGAAKALRWGLEKNGCHVDIWHRKQEFPLFPSARGSAHGMRRGEGELLINATPYGMIGSQPNDFLDNFQFHPRQTFYDLIYNPTPTPLMMKAKGAGCNAYDGYGMLVEQARLSFELWTGIYPS